MPTPWLVQRLRVRTYQANRKGVDSKFEMDYMGSAEFEFGTLPDTLRKMRSNPYPDAVIPFQIGKVTLYFVGIPASLEEAKALAVDQLGPRTMRFKEATCLNELLGPCCQYCGWWALDGNPLPWAIFSSKELAGEWLKLAYVAPG